jgi:hypothetical protein
MVNKNASSPKSVLEFLEKLRADRDELNALILGIEKRLGIVSNTGKQATGSNEVGPTVNIDVSDIPVGFFHNLGQAAAAEKLLRLNPGHPLTSQAIMETFRKSGVQSTSKNAMTILYTTLKRHPKFERVANKAWGLAEWYPEKRKRADKDDDEIEVPS